MATVVFFPEGAFGPTNNCVGIGQVLRERGHRVVFIVEESFAGRLEVRGFEERLMRLGPAPETQEVPGQFWIDFIRDTAPIFRKQTIEQLGEFIQPTWQALIDGAKYVDRRLREVIDELAPDVIVEDNVVGFPALPATGRPWAAQDGRRPRDGGLVYLSRGSLGSADVELMQRLVDVMGRTRHGVIVSMGPLADQIRLHDNMIGEAVLPQPAILPQVD